MSPEAWSQFAEALHAACVQNGDVHVNGEPGCFCPLGAFLTVGNTRPSTDEAFAVLGEYGFTFDEVDDFIVAFDDGYDDAEQQADDPSARALGLQFREAYP